MIITSSLEPTEHGTRISFEATQVPSAISPEDHYKGMQSTLENLAAFAEKKQDETISGK